MSNAWKWVLAAILAALFGLAGMALIPVPVHSQVAVDSLSWTAPGDDGAAGTATTYLMRWSRIRPDTTLDASREAWWGSATAIQGLPAPLPAGYRQVAAVGPSGGWTTGRPYYLVLRSVDEAGNVSGWSNVCVLMFQDVVPPRPIVDFGRK